MDSNLEEQVKSIRIEIDKFAERNKERAKEIYQELVNKIESGEKKTIFYYTTAFNNEGIMNYIEKNNISPKEIPNYLQIILNTNGMDLHLEGKDGKLVNVGDVQKHIYIASGYYKMKSQNKLHPYMSFEQIGLTLTEKGKKFFEEYKKISA